MDRLTYGVDPGLSTGISLLRDSELTGSWTTFMGVDGFVDWWADNSPPRDATFVIEDYVSDGTVNGQVWSSEVIGALYALHRGKIARQLRSAKAGLIRGTEAARNTWIDERFPGLPDQHQRDSICHALLYERNQRVPEVMRYWL